MDVLAAILQPVPVAEASQEDGKVPEETLKPAESEETEIPRLPEYLHRFTELNSKLQSLGKVEPAQLLTLTTQLVEAKLPALEGEDTAKYKQKLKEGEQERAGLIEREKELREKAKKQMEAREAAKAAKASA